MKQSIIITNKYDTQYSPIKYIAMPKIGCRLDKLEWDKVKKIIVETFQDLDIEILVCYL